MELYGFKMKKYEQENQALRDQLQEVKRSSDKQREEELASLKNHLTASFREKMNNARNAYDIQLAEL